MALRTITFLGFIVSCSIAELTKKQPMLIIYETEKSQMKPGAANFIFRQIADTNTRSALADVKIAGTGNDWKGWGSKAKHVTSSLKAVDPERVVAIIDSRDVLLNNFDEKSLSSFVENFESLTKGKENAIVVGAESQCCVSALTHAKPGDFLTDDLTRNGKSEACNSGKSDCLHRGEEHEKPWKDAMRDLANKQGAKTSKNIYPNTGIIVGKAKNILNSYDILKMKETEDDQALFTELLLKRPDLVILDYEQKLIGNNAWTEGMDGCVFDWDAAKEKFKHPTFETFPAFLHFQGKFYECYGKLARQFGFKGNMRRKLAAAPAGNNYGPSSSASQKQYSTFLIATALALATFLHM